MAALVWWLAACCLLRAATAGNPDAKRLYDDLLSNYNKLVRPVVNTTDVLRVCIKLKLSQLIDVVSVAACKHCVPGAAAVTYIGRDQGCTANAYLALARRIWNLNRHESHQRLGLASGDPVFVGHFSFVNTNLVTNSYICNCRVHAVPISLFARRRAVSLCISNQIP
ncbi:hypothetical protein ABMA27_000940 [Loxostege sticticalis]|uniref:Neurotransmitter-gated ion-channel ligand-binding domain-containing protein n=1 Tax=Loxostege sticticalis TaxID=481309 RepID=A0ABR3I168_LOXSC